MRKRDVVEFDGGIRGVVYDVYENSPMNVCSVLFKQSDGQIVAVALREGKNGLESEDMGRHARPSEYGGYDIPGT